MAAVCAQEGPCPPASASGPRLHGGEGGGWKSRPPCFLCAGPPGVCDRGQDVDRGFPAASSLQVCRVGVRRPGRLPGRPSFPFPRAVGWPALFVPGSPPSSVVVSLHKGAVIMFTETRSPRARPPLPDESYETRGMERLRGMESTSLGRPCFITRRRNSEAVTFQIFTSFQHLQAFVVGPDVCEDGLH